MAGFCAVSAAQGTQSKSSLRVEKDGAGRSINQLLPPMFSCGRRKTFTDELSLIGYSCSGFCRLSSVLISDYGGVNELR